MINIVIIVINVDITIVIYVVIIVINIVSDVINMSFFISMVVVIFVVVLQNISKLFYSLSFLYLQPSFVQLKDYLGYQTRLQRILKGSMLFNLAR